VAGLLSGVVVNNDAVLSCLENDNQLPELGPVPVGVTAPKLVVWQLPGDEEYYYVVVTTVPVEPQKPETASCATTILTFVNPAQPSPVVASPPTT
jgi:hypothetical protein